MVLNAAFMLVLAFGTLSHALNVKPWQEEELAHKAFAAGLYIHSQLDLATTTHSNIVMCLCVCLSACVSAYRALSA